MSVVLKTLHQKAATFWARLTKDRIWVHFLHVGKTGGTAIKAAVRKGGRKCQDGVDSVCTPSHRIFLHDHDVTLADIPKGEKYFFFLRDPIDRFVSAFYSRKRKGQPRYYSPWSDDEETAFRRFATPNDLASSLSSNDSEKRHSAIQAMRSINHVRDFYSRWYKNKKYFLSRISDALIVGRVEHLNYHFFYLQSLLNLSPEAQLPKSDERAHKNPYPELDTRLSEEAKDNLAKWYAEDYAFLDLCKHHASRLNYPV